MAKKKKAKVRDRYEEVSETRWNSKEHNAYIRLDDEGYYRVVTAGGRVIGHRESLREAMLALPVLVSVDNQSTGYRQPRYYREEVSA